MPCFGRDAMADVPDHKHRYHHLGMVQNLPPGVLAATLAKGVRSGSSAASMLLHRHNAKAAVLSSLLHAANEKEAALLPTDMLNRLQKQLSSMPLMHIGIPVVFHRTSFNSKFFPDCLDQKKTETKYCEVGLSAGFSG